MPVSPKPSLLVLPDGRELGYARYGAENGMPLLYLHGLPGSRLECLLIDTPAKQLGISVIAVDRPGYGASSPFTGSLADWTTDIKQLMTHLGWHQFAVMGVSGGGPCAITCADQLGSQVTRVALVAGLGPVYERSLMKNMGWVARASFFASRHAPVLLECCVGYPLAALTKLWPKGLVNILALANGQPDKRCLLRKNIKNAFSISLPACFAQGPKGALKDLKQFQQPWGIDFKDIKVSVMLWHGNRDSVVPLGHSEYLARQLSNAHLVSTPDEGHFSLPLLHMQELLSDFFGL